MVRGLIYAVAFFSGAILMGLEMVGSRVLAPYFGSSIFVWGSLIGVVLFALSIGYYAGGKLSDRYPGKGPLAAIFSVSGLFISLSGLYRERLLHAIASFFPGAAGPVFAAMALFFVPSTLLAMISPWCIRLSIGSVEGSGTTSGVLYSVSNAGSIIGTFATAFLLVPNFNVDSIIAGMAFILILFSGAIALSIEPKKRKGPSALVIVAIMILVMVQEGLGLPLIQGNVICDTQSLYHHILVVERGRERLLKFDNSLQGGMYLDSPFDSCFPYADYFHLAFCFKKDIKDVLMIGLGAGLVPKRFWRDYPGTSVDVVEIDEKVKEVANEYFSLPKDERFRIYVEDGRQFVKKTQKKYDLIMLDAYYADSIPFHLTTQEFYEEVKSHLKPGGVVAYNMIGTVTGEKSKLFRSMHLTFSTVFPVSYVFLLGYTPGNLLSFRNILVFGVNSGGEGKVGNLPLTKEEIVAVASELAKGKVSLKNFVSMAHDFYDEAIDHSGAVILTDKYAPVDSLLYLY